jgi:ornithine cyclodeaminase/alanine dehydrogenase-like protein (mu-crystallin family)
MDILNLDQLKELIDIEQLIIDLEKGYMLYSEGQVEVPPVGFLNFQDPPGDVHIKYGYIREDSVYVVKIASGFYNNPQLGISSSDGLLLVFSQETGKLESILLDECYLTDVRTAVGGAVAAKLLAPSKVSSIGIVGAGVQAKMQLEMLQHVIDCNKCIVWARDIKKANDFIEEIRQDSDFWTEHLEIEATSDMDYLTQNCNLIVTTTPSKSPLIMLDQINPGTHITAMGSDDNGKQELDAALLGKADILVADSKAQCIQYGEMSHGIKAGLIKESEILEIGELIKDKSKRRSNDVQITIADQTGVAVQDIQIAKMVNTLLRKSQAN